MRYVSITLNLASEEHTESERQDDDVGDRGELEPPFGSLHLSLVACGLVSRDDFALVALRCCREVLVVCRLRQAAWRVV